MPAPTASSPQGLVHLLLSFPHGLGNGLHGRLVQSGVVQTPVLEHRLEGLRRRGSVAGLEPARQTFAGGPRHGGHASRVIVLTDLRQPRLRAPTSNERRLGQESYMTFKFRW